MLKKEDKKDQEEIRSVIFTGLFEHPLNMLTKISYLFKYDERNSIKENEL